MNQTAAEGHDQAGEPADQFLGELRFGPRFPSKGHIVAGGLAILLGLSFLLAGRTVDLAGPWAALASVLAAVALGLTLLSMVEMIGGSGDSAEGTYALIHETQGGVISFLSGWAILAGGVALGAALARAAADHLQIFLQLPVPATYVGLFLFGALTLGQLLQVVPRRAWLWPAVVILFAALAVAVLSVVPHVIPLGAASSPGVEFADFLRSVAWMTTIYVAFETLLASRRRIQDPVRHLPPTILGTLLVAGLAIAVIMLVAAGAKMSLADAPAAVPMDTMLASILGAASLLPGWAVGMLAVAALLLACNGCLMAAARQAHALSRKGALLPELRRLWKRFPMPPVLFGALAAVAIPLILWAPVRWSVDFAATMFLVAMTALNVAAIQSHRGEPERRRSFVVPLYPLVPAVAIVVNLALLSALSGAGLFGGAVWLLLGVLAYVAYAQRHQVAAQEGVVVFGRHRRRERREGEYRILVPLSQGEERHLVLRLAAALARQLEGEVIALQVVPMPDPLAIEESRRIAQERNALFRWSTRLGEDMGVRMVSITRLDRSVPEGIVDTATEEGCDLVLMPWRVEESSSGMRMGRVLDPVVRKSPCDVAVVAYRPNGERDHGPEKEGRGSEAWASQSHTSAPVRPVSRILVPTAGGPHAPLAISLALALAREAGGTVTALFAARPGSSAQDIAEGEERIKHTIRAMLERDTSPQMSNGQTTELSEVPVESRVVVAPSVASGIIDAGADYDLVLIGASEESFIDQVLFGSIPEKVARASVTPVMMVKRYRGLPRFWLQRIWHALAATLPALSREERGEVYRQVWSGARPDVDFFVMMGLSAVIATFGLLQSSTAVIIGAMLVAPLFTPIMALSLAVAQGNPRLLRLGLESALKGIALAIGLAAALAVISPLRTITQEVAARTTPNLFDLAVALASGAAGAYAVARKDVAAALPGVAIAAAMVPPLSVIGIGLAMGEMGVAGGGGLLFVTNLTAIILAGSLVFLLLGFRPGHGTEGEVRLRVGLITTAILLALVTIPLATVFVRTAAVSQTRSAIDRVLTRQLEQMPEARLVSFEFQDHGDEVEVTVIAYAPEPISADATTRLSGELAKAVAKPVRLRLVAIPVAEIEIFSERAH